MSVLVKIVTSAVDPAETGTHCSGAGRGGGIKKIIIFSDANKTGEDLSFPGCTSDIAGEPFPASHRKEADLQIPI